MRVAVVGAGVVGLATASEPAAPRARCHRPRAVRGRTQPRSSHGRSRIVRLAYPELEWVRLAQEAMRKWRELEAEAGESLLALTGLVELEPRSAEALAACGIPYEELDAATLAERFGVRARGARRRCSSRRPATFAPTGRTGRSSRRREAGE